MTSVPPSGGSALTATYAGPDTTERRTFGTTTFQVGVYGIQSDTVAGTQHWFETDPTSSTPLAVSYGSGGSAVHAYTYTDVLGNISGMIDTAGAVATSYSYDPYGSLLINTGTVYNPWLYKTGYRDSATNLTKFGNRYYDPASGRWTQQDSLTSLNNPANGTRYAAFSDDPVNGSDPGGRNTIFSSLNGCLYGFCLGISYQADTEGGSAVEFSIGAGTPGFSFAAGFQQENVSSGFGWQVAGGAGPVYGGYGSSGLFGAVLTAYSTPYVAAYGTYSYVF